MKNFKNLFVMIFVVVALILVAPACKTQDVVEPDDIQFVSLTARVLTQYDGFADVSVDSVVKVKTFVATRIIGSIYLESRIRGFTADIPSTGGQWVDIPMPTKTFMPDFGTYEVRGEFTLESTGKMVSGTCTLIIK